MEQYQPLSDQPVFSLSIDSQNRDFLSESARWAKFLSIVGFVFCGLIVLLGIYTGMKTSAVSPTFTNPGFESGYYSNYRMLSGVVMVVYVVGAILYFFPCLYMFRFATRMRTALAAEDQMTLNSSFQNLKSLFKFMGILTIIVIAIYVLLFVIIAISAAARPF